jgi:hypothetical protein
MHPEKRPNPDPSPESLETRLRALPPPPVPADLEARLLAAIPAKRSVPERHWAVWVGLAGALAAACLVAVLAWPGRTGKSPSPENRDAPPQAKASPRSDGDSNRIPEWQRPHRDWAGAEWSTFTWPLPETAPVRKVNAIPSDLLD